MASSLFARKSCFPDLDQVPAIGTITLLATCDIPDPLVPVYTCPTFDLTPPVPVVNRALYIKITRGPVSGYYDWVEAVPDGLGGWMSGPRAGLISRYTWASEANGVVVTPSAVIYVAALIGGTGKCVFIAKAASDLTTNLYIQLTAYNAVAKAYDWRQVVSTAPGVWTPTGVTGSAAGGTGVADQNGLPAPPDGTSVYKAARDTAGNLVFNAVELGSGVIALTPADGIPVAASSTQPGAATVAFYYINKTTGLFTSIGASGVMYNMDPNGGVSGNTYVQGKVTPGLAILHDYELCPA